jgi:prostaglandin E receptor 4
MKMFNITKNISDHADHVTNASGATIVSPLLMSLTGVIGNILALISLYKTRTDVRTTKFYSLIKGLVWTDLLGIVITSPSVIIAYANQREWLGGSTHCLFHGFTMATFGLATPLIICAMAVERFLALKCVFFYSSRCRTGTARGCLLLVWLGTILFGLLPLFGFGRFEKQYPGTWCYLDFHSDDIVSKVYNYIYASTTLTLIFIIIICNTYAVVRILKTKVRRSSECVYTIGHNRPEQASLVTIRNQQVKSNDTESSMIVLLLALTLVFTTCWAPLMVCIN